MWLPVQILRKLPENPQTEEVQRKHRRWPAGRMLWQEACSGWHLLPDDTETEVKELEDTAVWLTADFQDYDESLQNGSDQDGDEPVQDTRQVLSLAVTGAGDSNASVLVIPAPKTGGKPVSGVNASDGTYTGAVTWNPSGEVFAGETSYQALVVLYASRGLYVCTKQCADSRSWNHIGHTGIWRWQYDRISDCIFSDRGK